LKKCNNSIFYQEVVSKVAFTQIAGKAGRR
jgi:type I site-specific restriction endonuclease